MAATLGHWCLAGGWRASLLISPCASPAAAPLPGLVPAGMCPGICDFMSLLCQEPCSGQLPALHIAAVGPGPWSASRSLCRPRIPFPRSHLSVRETRGGGGFCLLGPSCWLHLAPPCCTAVRLRVSFLFQISERPKDEVGRLLCWVGSAQERRGEHLHVVIISISQSAHESGTL